MRRLFAHFLFYLNFAFLALIGIAWWESGIFVSYRWESESESFRLVQAMAQLGRPALDGIPEGDHRLDSLAPADRQRVMRAFGVREVDAWRMPYHLVIGKHRPAGLYSTGKDGISNSGGNDPDDFNSWSGSRPDDYYSEQTHRAEWRSRIVSALVYGAILHLIAWTVFQIVSGLRCRPRL